MVQWRNHHLVLVKLKSRKESLNYVNTISTKDTYLDLNSLGINVNIWETNEHIFFYFTKSMLSNLQFVVFPH